MPIQNYRDRTIKLWFAAVVSLSPVINRLWLIVGKCRKHIICHTLQLENELVKNTDY